MPVQHAPIRPDPSHHAGDARSPGRTVPGPPARRARWIAVLGVVLAMLVASCGPAGDGGARGPDVALSGVSVAHAVGVERTRIKDTQFRTTRQIAQLPLPEGHSTELGPEFARGPGDEDDVGPYISIELAEDSPLLRVPDDVEVEGADDEVTLALADDAVARASQYVVEEVVDSDVLRSPRPEDHRDWFGQNRWRFDPGLAELILENLEENGGLPVHHLRWTDPDDEDENGEESGPNIYNDVVQPDQPRVTDLEVEVTALLVHQDPVYPPRFMVEHEISYGTPQCETADCHALEIIYLSDSRRTIIYPHGDAWYILGYYQDRDVSADSPPAHPVLEPFSWDS